jgi:hypothetical protein
MDRKGIPRLPGKFGKAGKDELNSDFAILMLGRSDVDFATAGLGDTVQFPAERTGATPRGAMRGLRKRDPQAARNTVRLPNAWPEG